MENNLNKCIAECGVIKEEITIEDSHDLKDFVMEEFHDDDGQPHKCGQCLKVFKKPYFLTQHQIQVHGKEGKFACEICSKHFMGSCDLSRHLITHSDEKNFKCEQCGKFFKRKEALAEHKQIVHTIDRSQSLQCEVCSKIFTRASSLKRHSNYAHNEERRYKCEQCFKLFKTTNILARHLISHSNKREFKCHKCDNKYKSKLDLNCHIKYIHATVKPFQCKECTKSFATAAFLRKHAIFHSDDRPFQCDECSKTYKTQFDLSTHKILKHGTGGRFSCEVCGQRYQRLDKFQIHVDKHYKKSKSSVKSFKFLKNHHNSHNTEEVETFKDAQVEGGETINNVKVEPIVIYDAEVKPEVLYIKEEIEHEMDVKVKQEPQEIEKS